jgi:hypothetical protein
MSEDEMLRRIAELRQAGGTMISIGKAVGLSQANVNMRLIRLAEGDYVDPQRRPLPAGHAVSWGAISDSPYDWKP